MKISIVVLTAALAGQAVATWGFGKAGESRGLTGVGRHVLTLSVTSLQ